MRWPNGSLSAVVFLLSLCLAVSKATKLAHESCTEHRSERPWENAGGMQLDQDGLAFLYPEFLNKSEIATILQLSENRTSENPANGLSMLDSTVPFAGITVNTSHEPVLAAVDERIAQLTGIPSSDAEPPFMLQVRRAWNWENEGELYLRNLHHGQNDAPRRVATVLIYLDDEADGGETYFPCLRPKLGDEGGANGDHEEDGGNGEEEHASIGSNGGGGGGGGDNDDDDDDGDDDDDDDDDEEYNGEKEAEEEELCRRLRSGYMAGERSLEPYVFPSSFDSRAASIADKACRRVREDSSMSGLMVRPRAGAALLFWSVQPGADGPPAAPSQSSPGLSHMWHGGCRVWQAEEWTLHRFKELPLSHDEPRPESSEMSPQELLKAWKRLHG